MKNLHIAFFTEAGTLRGMGHLVRSHTISQKFASLGIKISFFLDSDMDFSDKYCDIKYFKWNELYVEKDIYDIIFIDSYEATLNMYNQIYSACKVAVYIDDFKRLDYPKGVILNFAPDAKELLYGHKKEKYTYLLGLKYIPIRDNFLDIKIDKKEQIFIMLGGSDVANLSIEVISLLHDITINKVIVSNNKSIRNKLLTYKNVEVLFHPSDIKLIKTMANSTMAISTASMTAYELAYLKIPTILIAVAENQEDGLSQLIKYRITNSVVSIRDDMWKVDFTNAVKELLAYEKKPNNEIDGKGTEQIVDNILELLV